jgi:hypothetical protein
VVAGYFQVTTLILYPKVESGQKQKVRGLLLIAAERYINKT